MLFPFWYSFILQIIMVFGIIYLLDSGHAINS